MARLAWYKMENGKMVTAQTGMSATVAKNDAVDACGTFLPCFSKGDSSELMVRVVPCRNGNGKSVRAATTIFVWRQRRLLLRLLLLPMKDCTSVRLTSNTVAMEHQRIVFGIFLMFQIFAELSTGAQRQI
jgi:hypothetical protein